MGSRVLFETAAFTYRKKKKNTASSNMSFACPGHKSICIWLNGQQAPHHHEKRAIIPLWSQLISFRIQRGLSISRLWPVFGLKAVRFRKRSCSDFACDPFEFGSSHSHEHFSPHMTRIMWEGKLNNKKITRHSFTVAPLFRGIVQAVWYCNQQRLRVTLAEKR